MKALNRLGGALLVAILIIAVVTGLQTGQGERAFNNVWNATKIVLGWAGDQISRLGVNVDTAGNLGKALVIGLIIFTLAILFVPGARAGRGLAVSAVVSIAIALLLFQPSLGTSLRNAVSAPAPAASVLR